MNYRCIAVVPLTFALCLLSTFSFAESKCLTLKNKSVLAKVLKVSDGDTAKVSLIPSRSKISVRFYGVDTPESEWPGKWPAQPYSHQAKSFTASKISNKVVTVKFTGDGTHNRCVGEIFIDDKSLSLLLIENGLGWWYKSYALKRKDLKKAQRRAKRARRGIWSRPVPPWEYRRKFD